MTTPPPYGQDPLPPTPEHNQGQPPPPQDPYQPQQPQQPQAYPQPPTYQPPQAYPPPGYQVSGPPGYQVSGGGQPYSPYPPPYSGGGPGYGGFDPLTGQPYSDKSKLAAGLLQLLPGFFLGLGGIGRLYAGYTSLGVVQIVVSVVGWISFWCGFLLIFPFLIFAGAWLWAVIDGILLLAGRPTDPQGRPLRP